MLPGGSAPFVGTKIPLLSLDGIDERVEEKWWHSLASETDPATAVRAECLKFQLPCRAIFGNDQRHMDVLRRLEFGRRLPSRRELIKSVQTAILTSPIHEGMRPDWLSVNENLKPLLPSVSHTLACNSRRARISESCNAA